LGSDGGVYGKCRLAAPALLTEKRYYLGGGGLLAYFTEIESGKRADRPQLKVALDLCKRKKATLVIAKLDRLSRNASTRSSEMNSGTEKSSTRSRRFWPNAGGFSTTRSGTLVAGLSLPAARSLGD
jgi:Resolvase, N terminal domain